jgi:DNA recombination protein RmuC
MLLAVIALQVVLVLLVAVLLARKSAPAAVADLRMAALPDAVVALSAKVEATDGTLRSQVSELRREQAEAATSARHADELASRALREEINNSINALAKTLNDHIAGFRVESTSGLTGLRGDNAASAEKLREAVARELTGIGDRLTVFFAETAKQERDARAALHASLTTLAEKNSANNEALRAALQQSLATMGVDQREAGERLRGTVEVALKSLSTENTEKLEQMRVTVDEKLEATLNDRLTKSFGQVTTHLGEVQKGLGEMKELATGVSDLKKVFSNVKSRGIVGEFQLGMQLEQMFSRDQYEVNVPVKANSQERVEYALKIPDGDRDHVLLPIDAKFPREDWERLEHAYEHGTEDEKSKAGTAFERAIRIEGKRICDKYIDPPNTLPFAIMFLPTEALYAEVMRRPGLHTELQNSCHVTVAGPSSFMAILTSFQMGFRTMAIQKKGNEVWKVLGSVKKEFSKFELLMNKVEKNVQTVQNTLGEIGQRSRVINRNLHNVSELNAPPEPVASGLLSFDDAPGVAPLLAAMSEEEEPRA